jgi:hypothetical protein
MWIAVADKRQVVEILRASEFRGSLHNGKKLKLRYDLKGIPTTRSNGTGSVD